MASKIKSKQRKSIPSSPISPCVVRTSKMNFITEIDIDPLKKEIEELKKQLLLIKNENKVTVDELRKEVNSLKQDVARSEDRSRVQSTVNDRLRAEVDRLEQYGRRNCIVLKGIPPKKQESTRTLEESIQKILSEDLKLEDHHVADFDKAHRIGPVFTDNKGKPQQHTIVRHSSRYAAYLKRNNLRSKRMKITPSLTNRRRKLLDEANEKFSDHPLIDFLFCDIHGDLKVKLGQPLNNKSFYKFDDLEEIQYLLHEVNIEDHSRTASD